MLPRRTNEPRGVCRWAWPAITGRTTHLIFVRDGKGGHIHDIDGNEYTDFNLCFGALMVGHCHPAVIKAVQAKLGTGTMFGMPHDLEWELAEEICKRFPVEMVRFSNSGTECTGAHAVRLARAATGA